MGSPGEPDRVGRDEDTGELLFLDCAPESPKGRRRFGGAIFGHARFGTVLIYHNGAESYYAARGFRCMLRV